MNQDEFTQLLAGTAKLMPLATEQEIFLVVSSALSTLAFDLLDWRAVLHFLSIQENRDRISVALARGMKAAGAPGGANPPRH